MVWFQFHVHDKMDLQVWFELEPKPSIEATFVPRQKLWEHSDNLWKPSDTVFRSATTTDLQQSDRAIVRRAIKADGRDNSLYGVIKLSILPAPVMSITPWSPRYVLALTQEPALTG
jgi:hypothetical protein